MISHVWGSETPHLSTQGHSVAFGGLDDNCRVSTERAHREPEPVLKEKKKIWQDSIRFRAT